jgi:RNA polymerase sigma factor (sigma-70 family)
MNDRALLASYINNRSADAFAQIVREYTNVVYSAALRQAGNVAQAEEITQAVFVILAKKARAISSDTPLVGWLLATTRFAALNLRRAELRRRRHERKAAAMEATQPVADTDEWQELAPYLDEAMATLRSDQRNAVALRYFQGCAFAAVAKRLSISEEAAKKRVSRGVDELRRFFERRGIVVPSAALSSGLSLHAVHSAPAHLAASCAVSGAGTTLGQELLRLMLIGKAKLIAASVLGIALVGGMTATTIHIVRTKSQSAMRIPSGPRVIAVSDIHAELFHGRVVDSDGRPLSGVTVFEPTSAQPVHIYPMPAGESGAPMFTNPEGLGGLPTFVFRPSPEPPSATTDGNGAFALPVSAGTPSLVVKDDRGFAQVHLEDLKDGGTIKLEPWARIEGYLRVKDRKPLKQQIYLARFSYFIDPYESAVIQYTAADVAADGHFVFPRVAPGASWLFTKSIANDTMGPSAFVRAESSQIAHADVGAGGRIVQGRFVPPSGINQTVEYRDPRHWTNLTLSRLPTDTMKLPLKWILMDEQDRTIYRDAWQQTPEAQKWNESLIPQGADIELDGSFHFIGVQPGRYVLTMNNFEHDHASGYADQAASYSAEIDVPAGADEHPMDLGSRAVELQPHLRVKKPAPALQVASLAPGGAPIDLSQFHGKYVLLCLWDTIGLTQIASGRGVDMAAIDQEFASNSDIVLLGVNTDHNTDAARQFIASNHLDHWRMASAPLQTGLPEEYKRSASGAVLIGPNGNVVTLHLFGDRVATVLRRELAK